MGRGPLARRLEERAGGALRRALGLLPGCALRLVKPATGRGGRTFLVEVDGRAVAVLRALRQRRRLLRLSEAGDSLRAQGVPVARVLWRDPSPVRRLWRGAYLILEEHIAGATLGTLAERGAALDSLAAALARLHAVRRREWGTLHRRKRSGFGPFRLGQIGSLLRRLRRSGSLEGPAARALHAAFGAWRERLDSLRDFHLIHNDLHFENVLAAPDGSVRIIDLYRLRFDRRERELAGVCGRLLDLEAGATSRFLERYAGAGGERPEAGLLEFETAVLCLARWASLRERAEALPRGERRDSVGALSDRWRERAAERAARIAAGAPAAR